MRARPLSLTLFLILGGSPAFAQVAAPPPPLVRQMQNFEALPRPPVPTDPLELVTGPAQATDTPELRIAATTLLNKAHELSDVRAQPYDLKTSFTATGGSTSDGTWSLEDTAPGRGIYRWTAQGPAYSVINLYVKTTQGILYSNQPAGAVPLRLEQVREALFFVFPGLGPRMSIRTAAGYLNGAAQNCVLTSPGIRERLVTGSRNWEESEYCMDAGTGLLTTYSPAPGLFIHYDYSSAVPFNGKTIAGAFTITEGGRPVVEAYTLGVTNPPDPKSAIFDSTGLISLGVGREMTPVARVWGTVPAFNRAPTGGTPAIQVVVLHGNAGPDGKLTDAAVLASSDASVNQAAMDRTTSWNGPAGRSQPGATAQSHEVFFTWEFMTYQ